MLRRVKNLLALPLHEKVLVLEVLILTGFVRMAILVLPFRWLALILGKRMQESPAQEDSITVKVASRIGTLVEIVSRFTPWESKCLVQAIVCKLILRQRGFANTLYFGVSKGEGNRLIAHAWLRCGEAIVAGNLKERFTVVSKFADRLN